LDTSSLVQRWSRILGCLILLVGVAGVVLSPFLGARVSPILWAVEPLAYAGAGLIIVGLAITTLSYVIPRMLGQEQNPQDLALESRQRWGQLTQQYFELFNHDLGRPLRGILGKERELRAILRSSESELYPTVKELLDEIEGQAPNFRLMMSNIQVLVQMEAPMVNMDIQPVEPSELIRKIVDRYTFVASAEHKEISWWAEPSEFGIVYCDSSAIEHIVTNLVDNAVRFSTQRVEIRLTKNPTSFFIRVWDDGPGIAPHYIRHIFDRGWTPQVAKREEKSSSGLGLFIARTLAKQYGGDITVESVPEPDPNHCTTFLLSLPLRGPNGHVDYNNKGQA
jgi:signal transduction histidine kinase